MAERRNINVNTNPAVAKEFRVLAARFNGRIGVLITAAMIQFLESHPEVQGEFVKRALELDVRADVEDLVEEIRKNQAEKVRIRDRRK